MCIRDRFTTDVDADKNAKEEIVTEDGVVIEDGGWGSDDEESWEITDWNEVSAMKATIPQLIIPEYIPDNLWRRDCVYHSSRINDLSQFCLALKNHQGAGLALLKRGSRIYHCIDTAPEMCIRDSIKAVRPRLLERI